MKNTALIHGKVLAVLFTVAYVTLVQMSTQWQRQVTFGYY